MKVGKVARLFIAYGLLYGIPWLVFSILPDTRSIKIVVFAIFIAAALTLRWGFQGRIRRAYSAAFDFEGGPRVTPSRAITLLALIITWLGLFSWVVGSPRNTTVSLVGSIAVLVFVLNLFENRWTKVDLQIRGAAPHAGV